MRLGKIKFPITFEYCRRAGLVAQTFNTALKMNRITKFQITTAACLLAILCYGLPFHDNALGGLVKPTIIVMAKSQKGGSQPPKKQTKVTLPPAPKKKTGMDGLRDLGKYVSTFGLATEGYNPRPNNKKKK